jgi:hypothetical protein
VVCRVKPKLQCHGDVSTRGGEGMKDIPTLSSSVRVLCTLCGRHGGGGGTLYSVPPGYDIVTTSDPTAPASRPIRSTELMYGRWLTS